MKNTLLVLITILLIFTVFVSCNGTVDDEVFDVKTYHTYELQEDGSWKCVRKGCYTCIEGTNKPYIALIKNGKLDEDSIINLTSDVDKKNLGTGTVTVSSNEITYDNTGNGNEAQEVIIRTGINQTLTVKGKIGTSAKTSDEIHHYGAASEINLNVADFCFYTHARVKEMNINHGKAIADKNGFVELVKAEDGSEVEEKNGGIFVIPEETTVSDISEPIIEDLGYKTEGSKIVLDESSPKAEEKKVIIDNQKEYKIHTVDELIELREKYNSGLFYSESIVLENDIDLTGIDWIPIGTWEYPFYGTFDGNNKTIKGLTLTENASNQIYSYGKTIDHEGEIFGFFGIVGDLDGDKDEDVDVVIKNVSFTDVSICNENAHNVGTVIAYAPLSTDFYDEEEYKGSLYAPGKWDGNEDIGKTKIEIENVSVSGKIDVYSHAGGFIGKLFAESSAALKGCSNNMDITTHNRGGLAGFVGYAKSTNISFDGCTYTNDAKLSFDNSSEEKSCDFYIGDYYAGNDETIATFTNTTDYAIKVAIEKSSKITLLSAKFTNETTIDGITANKFYNYGKAVLKNSKVGEYIKNVKGELTVDSSEFVKFFNLATATLKNSEAKSDDAESKCPINYYSGSKTVIESGSYKMISYSTTDSFNNPATIEIKGGSFYSTIKKHESSTITVSGGTFYYSSLSTTAKKILKNLLEASIDQNKYKLEINDTDKYYSIIEKSN